MEKWTTVIKPRTGLFDVNFKEIWQYKDLWSLFVKRDIVTQYKQTILGPTWFVIQPIMTTVMFMVVFGRIAQISTDGLPQPLFYLAGICLWQYFSECLNKTSDTFVANAGIFGKVYFPRLVMPLATVTSNLVRFFIQLGLFVIVYLYYVIFTDAQVFVTAYALLFPLLILILAGLALGFGILFSALTTKYRDLTKLLGFVVQLWMYATPIIYPISMIAAINATAAKVMLLNPVAQVIQDVRFSFVTRQTDTVWSMSGNSVVIRSLKTNHGLANPTLAFTTGTIFEAEI